VTAGSNPPGPDAPRLEYRMTLYTAGRVEVHVYLSPTFDFLNTGGLRYAVAFDDEPPQIMNYSKNVSWLSLASNNVMVKRSRHKIDAPGVHVLKIWRLDPGLVVEKIVVDTGGLRRSYLGPPESPFRRAAAQ
jgi:hypothetical protein